MACALSLDGAGVFEGGIRVCFAGYPGTPGCALIYITLGPMSDSVKAVTKCYMCDQIAVSDEHVPPRCIFPKAKDLPVGVDFRKDLITVPSCTDHNSEKSREDQYFLNVIAGSDLINEVGREHYRRQIRRQNERNQSILARFAKRAIEVGKRLAHKVEIDRLDSFVKHLGCGLYFAQFGKRWQGELGWFPEFLSRITDTDLKAERLRFAVIEVNNLEFENVPFCGANPKVFAYQVLGTMKQCKMRLHFYEGCRILLVFSA